MNLLGIDAGTTGLKAVLFDSESGSELGTGYVEYPLETPGPELAEINPEVWFNALKNAAKAAMAQAGVKQCQALAISSQGESFVLLDRQKRVLRKAIVWLDRRSTEECHEIETRFGLEKIYHTTGDPAVDPTWLGTKLLYLKKHEPQIWAKTAHILLAEDYLLFKLTGKIRGNGALWCSTLLFDLVKQDYWDEMLEYIGVSRAQLPEQVKSGIPVGNILPEIAAEIGFEGNVTAVSGGMDQACSALGSGNILSGMATDNTGTSFNLAATSNTPVFDPKFRLPCQLHVLNSTYLAVAWSPSGGILLRWFRDTIVPEWAAQLQRDGHDFYEALTAEAQYSAPGANGVLILPHLSGALCPELAPDAKAVISGLSLQTTRGDLARAMLESVACMARANLDLLQDCGLKIKELKLAGGAARSSLWNRIKAGITGIPAQTLIQPEAGCLGAAMLAGMGVGAFPSPIDAVTAMVKTGRQFAPEPELVTAGEITYRNYRQLFLKLK